MRQTTRTTTSLIAGQVFCHTKAGIVSGPALLSGDAEKTVWVTSSNVRGVIGNWFSLVVTGKGGNEG